MKIKALALDRKELLSYDLVLPLLSFCIPFLVSGPQLLTGTLVNSFLFLASNKIRGKRIIPTVILPSLGALSHGIIFGGFTQFLIFFLPFIWIGNTTIVAFNEKLRKIFSFPIALILISLLKASVLYTSALLFFNFNIVPEFFLSSMGLVQFITAFMGGLIAYIIMYLIDNYE